MGEWIHVGVGRYITFIKLSLSAVLYSLSTMVLQEEGIKVCVLGGGHLWHGDFHFLCSFIMSLVVLSSHSRITCDSSSLFTG